MGTRSAVELVEEAKNKRMLLKMDSVDYGDWKVANRMHDFSGIQVIFMNR